MFLLIAGNSITSFVYLEWKLQFMTHFVVMQRLIVKQGKIDLVIQF